MAKKIRELCEEPDCLSTYSYELEDEEDEFVPNNRVNIRRSCVHTPDFHVWDYVTDPDEDPSGFNGGVLKGACHAHDPDGYSDELDLEIGDINYRAAKTQHQHRGEIKDIMAAFRADLNLFDKYNFREDEDE